MEKKNKYLILFTTIVIVLVIVVTSIVKVYNNHVDGQYKVVEKRIRENALKCFNEGLCKGDETTLEELINKGYIKRQINPITKEYISDDLVIKYDKGKCTFSIR